MHWTTTLDEYEQYIERRCIRERFQKIIVEPLGRGNNQQHQNKYEDHHNVMIFTRCY
jgi:ATP-dependent Clp protease ATP-binding subunit ClpA